LFENVLPVATSVDSFSSYSQGNPTLELAYKDVVIGSGEVASMGKVLTVAYKGRLLSNGKQFDEGKGFSFRLGEGRVIPGWEKGLEVREYTQY
jgi:FKBP-type peptidyl-prolyl cis-trans isomerase